MSGGIPGSQKLADSLKVVKLTTAGAGFQPGPLIPRQEMGWDPQMEPCQHHSPRAAGAGLAALQVLASSELKGHMGYLAMKTCSVPWPRSKAQTQDDSGL